MAKRKCSSSKIEFLALCLSPVSRLPRAGPRPHFPRSLVAWAPWGARVPSAQARAPLSRRSFWIPSAGRKSRPERGRGHTYLRQPPGPRRFLIFGNFLNAPGQAARTSSRCGAPPPRPALLTAPMRRELGAHGLERRARPAESAQAAAGAEEPRWGAALSPRRLDGLCENMIPPTASINALQFQDVILLLLYGSDIKIVVTVTYDKKYTVFGLVPVFWHTAPICLGISKMA
ncbi:uncharacterized protein [Macaca nemestrina]|uniref:uncharacterized protein n=1 Tax=Macaca nemestrina TaxID=9545 RepID=UPI0039B8B4AD